MNWPWSSKNTTGSCSGGKERAVDGNLSSHVEINKDKCINTYRIKFKYILFVIILFERQICKVVTINLCQSVQNTWSCVWW